MAKLGEIVILNMCHINGNEPTAAIVVKASDDGSISAYAFPANGEAPTFLTGIAPRDKVDETYLSYGDPTPTPEPVTLPDGTPLGDQTS